MGRGRGQPFGLASPPTFANSSFMNMKKQTFINALCGTAFSVLALAATAVAQPSSGGPGPAPVPSSGPTEVPLDGGASLLLAGGVAYGLKRLRERRTKD